jgi:ribonuclease R
LFVTLDAMYVEGLVHITELGGEYFRFDEARQELRGERTGTRYAIGTRVRIQVSRVDLDGRKIDFRLINEHDTLLRSSPDKGAVKEGKTRSPKVPFEGDSASRGNDGYGGDPRKRAGAKAGRAGKTARPAKSAGRTTGAKKTAGKRR